MVVVSLGASGDGGLSAPLVASGILQDLGGIAAKRRTDRAHLFTEGAEAFFAIEEVGVDEAFAAPGRGRGTVSDGEVSWSLTAGKQ
jgi:hypothetical protein